MKLTLCTAAALAAAIFCGVAADAASVDINPVRIDLAGTGVPAEIKLTNTGDTELSVQVDALQWQQDLDGADQLLETNELLAVPPLFSIPPGEHQIVRVGFLGEQSPELEQSFRLLVTELAAAPDAQSTSQLSMRMRFSIPAFVTPSIAVPRPSIVVNDVTKRDDATIVRIENVGNAHAQVAEINIRGEDGWYSLAQAQAVRYLLPGAIATVVVPLETGELSAIRISSIDGRDWEYVVRSSQ